MKRLIAKMRRLKMTCWAKLTLGEKIIKVIVSLIKVAAIVAIALATAGVVVAAIAGFAIAMGIANAIGGGFDYVRRDDRYVRFW